jgi:hypothetical protein
MKVVIRQDGLAMAKQDLLAMLLLPRRGAILLAQGNALIVAHKLSGSEAARICDSAPFPKPRRLRLWDEGHNNIFFSQKAPSGAKRMRGRSLPSDTSLTDSRQRKAVKPDSIPPSLEGDSTKKGRKGGGQRLATGINAWAQEKARRRFWLQSLTERFVRNNDGGALGWAKDRTFDPQSSQELTSW